MGRQLFVLDTGLLGHCRTMRALVKAEAKPGMILDERPDPQPEPSEVRIAVEAVGIDGGLEALVYDWHPSWQHLEPDLPRVFGHEFSGVIDAVGSEVTGLSVGDPVAVEPDIWCGSCRNCMNGDINVCQHSDVIGIDMDGAFAEYVTAPARNVYPLPSEMELDAGAYLEVLAIGLNALEHAEFCAGDDVAVTGPGPVGLSTVIASRAGGADSLTVVGADIDRESRLPIASQMGATETHTIDEAPADPSVDVFFEASGHPSALEYAIEKTRSSGQIIQIGAFHDDDKVPVDVTELIDQNIGLRPIRARRDSSWRRAISVAADSDLSPIIGPSFPLSEYQAAFDAVRNREGVKVLLTH